MKTLNSTITIAVMFAASVAVGQDCRDGVCRIRPETSSRSSRYVDEYRTRSDYRNSFDRFDSRQACATCGGQHANGNCGRDCNCGPNSECCLTGNCGPGCNCDCWSGGNCGPNGNCAVRGDFRYEPQPRQYNNAVRNDSGQRRLSTPRPLSFQAPSPRTRSLTPASFRTQIAWENDYRKAVELSRQSGRPMLVRVGADWCSFCQRMKRETFTDRRVITDVSTGFIPVELDADRSRDLVRKMKVTTLPTILVIGSDLRILDKQEGFRSAAQLSQSLTRHLQRAQLMTPVKVASR